MEFELEMVETLKRKTVIEAPSKEEALKKLEDEYKKCNIILTSEDTFNVDFKSCDEQLSKESFNKETLLQELLDAGGCDGVDEYSKGYDEAMIVAYDIVCKHLDMDKEKGKQNDACKIV